MAEDATGEQRESALVRVARWGSVGAAGAIAAGTGAAIGFAVGGPLGLFVGGAAGRMLGRAIEAVGSDLVERHLAPREKERIGSVLLLALPKIEMRLNRGDEVRAERLTESGRPEAQELLEGVLIAGQHEPEERKLHYYANLLANLPFEHDIDRSDANALIRIAESLTYRQLCLLAIVGRKRQFRLPDRPFEFRDALRPPLVSVLQEAYDLIRRGLISSRDSVLDIQDFFPAKSMLVGLGYSLFALMELRSISEAEIVPLLAILGGMLDGGEGGIPSSSEEPSNDDP